LWNELLTRLLPDGCFALLALIVGAAAYWTLGLGYEQLPLQPRLTVALLHTMITVLAMLPAIVLCNRWGERKPWVLVIAIPITIVIWVLLFGVIVAPIIDSDAFPKDFAGTSAVVKEVLSVSCEALAFYGVTISLHIHTVGLHSEMHRPM